MKDLDLELFNFDTFFASSDDDDDGVDGLWAISAISDVCHDNNDLLDETDLGPLSRTNGNACESKQEQVEVKQDLTAKFGLKIDTTCNNRVKEGLLAQSGHDKTNGTPTSTLPARFALLSTTCVYEPGFTTSPRGKRRISQIHIAQNVAAENKEEDRDDGDEDEEADVGETEVLDANGDEPCMLLRAEDYNLPVFTDAELSAMVGLPLEASSTSTSSATPSFLPRELAHEPRSCGNSIIQDTINTLSMEDGAEHENMNVNNMLDLSSGNSQTFTEAPHQAFDFSSAANSSIAMAPCIVPLPSQAMFTSEPINTTQAMSVSTASSSFVGSCAIPLDYMSLSGYNVTGNQFYDSHCQHMQSFDVNYGAPFFHGQQQIQPIDDDGQFAMAMANSAVMNTMLRMNANYGVPVTPVQCQGDSKLSATQAKVAAPIKLRLPIQRIVPTTSMSAFAHSKKSGYAITSDIADFKLVQIFHSFCDPTTKMITLPRFQLLLSHHSIKDTALSKSDSPKDTTADAQTLFKALNVSSLDLERFMQSFQICNRCTETKRRAHQALCARQGKTFTFTLLERQLMEDVVPVVVRVVPVRFEGKKVKSCEHYQWTWCEGFDKTGNEKCRGTNRHDKCPKYLANCTLWKHKLPPKSRKPRVLVENVDSPTKRLKHFS